MRFVAFFDVSVYTEPEKCQKCLLWQFFPKVCFSLSAKRRDTHNISRWKSLEHGISRSLFTRMNHVFSSNVFSSHLHLKVRSLRRLNIARPLRPRNERCQGERFFFLLLLLLLHNLLIPQHPLPMTAGSLVSSLFTFYAPMHESHSICFPPAVSFTPIWQEWCSGSHELVLFWTGRGWVPIVRGSFFLVQQGTCLQTRRRLGNWSAIVRYRVAPKSWVCMGRHIACITV